jgi:hypothetical protein
VRGWRDASTSTLGSGNAQAAVAGTAAKIVLALGLDALLNVRDGRGLAHTSAAIVAVSASVTASAAVVQVGLKVLAGIGRGAAKGGSRARAWAD